MSIAEVEATSGTPKPRDFSIVIATRAPHISTKMTRGSVPPSESAGLFRGASCAALR